MTKRSRRNDSPAFQARSSEIIAIPDLLDALTLKGSIVTLDAMGCQKKIVSKILDRGADYLITLMANQGRMFKAVRDHCEQTCFASGATSTAHFDRLTTPMAGPFAAGLSFAPKQPGWNRCATGPDCARCSRSRLFAASTAQAKRRPKSDTSCRVAPMNRTF